MKRIVWRSTQKILFFIMISRNIYNSNVKNKGLKKQIKVKSLFFKNIFKSDKIIRNKMKLISPNKNDY